MGCLCPKNIKTQNTNDLNEQLNEDPTPTEKGDIEANHITIGLSKYQDISQKRKFAEYLISNDYGVFKRLLFEVKNLNDEDFNALFEGETEHNYNVSNKKDFKQLAQKFDDNKDLLMEYYDQEKYYEMVLQIWRPNILYKLKTDQDEEAKYDRLKKHKIEFLKWDPEFKKYFDTITENSPLKNWAERMSNYIEANYGTYDELIKTVRKSKKKIEKQEKSSCSTNIGINLNTASDRILKDFVPKFLNSISKEMDNIPKQLKEKEKEKAFNYIKKNVFSETDQKRLIEQVTKIYEEKISNSGFFSENEELEEVKNLFQKFNDENLNNDLYYFDMDDREDIDPTENMPNLQYEGLTIEDKAKTFFSNKTIKHAIFGLSVVNLGYSVTHLVQTFITFDQKKFEKKYKEIEERFNKHKLAVKIVDLDSDVDEALKLVGEWGANFDSDLEDVQNLLKEIEETINNAENEKNKVKLNIVGSVAGEAIGFVGTLVTKGEECYEYMTSSGINLVSLLANCTDLGKLKTEIKGMTEIQQKVSKLEEDIKQEIEKLKKKFDELKTKHTGD